MEDRAEEVEEFYTKHPEFRPSKSGFTKDSAQAAGDRPERLGGKVIFTGLGYENNPDRSNSERPMWKNTSMEQRETRQRVERIMETLSEARQDLLRRYYWEQQTLQEIATDYGVSYQAIQQRLDTARGAFSRALVKMAYAGELDLVEEEGI